MQVNSELKFGVFLLPSGQHVGAWRLPEARPGAGVDFGYIVELAQRCENAKLDFIFLADVDGLVQTDQNAISRDAAAFQFEPMTLLSAIGAVTKHIGLVGSVSTEYNQPYHVARKFSSLETISGGRAGWNIVTSVWSHVAANFSNDTHRQHGDRYARAGEFIDVVTGLWDSWGDNCIVNDKASGSFVDVSKLHVLNHEGEHFASAGPLTLPRSPQGHPVLVQAGSSEPGRELAAATAEVIFTAQNDIEMAREFYADVKGRLAKHGRTADQLKVMPGMMPIVGRTQAEADAKFARLAALLDPALALSYVSRFMDTDLSGLDLDDPLPEIGRIDGHTSRKQLIAAKAHERGMTLRQVYEWFAVSRGHFLCVGPPERIADDLEEWFRTGAADGFNLLFANLPSDLEDFAELLLPELRRRGLFRNEYEGTTLRETLGLERPSNRFQAA
jgi:FMN-dependent oxidoreductase (nitrilotriacetate monooxygenase family)